MLNRSIIWCGLLALVANNAATHIGTATQSTTGWGGIPGRAIDGNDSGNYKDRSCTHTKGERRPWWSVDFGSQRKVYGISITNRKDCCYERLYKFEVVLLNKGEGCTASGKVVLSVDHPFHGTRTFKILPSDGYKLEIRFKDTGKSRYLTLCEVKVYFKAEDIPDTDNHVGTATQSTTGWGGTPDKAIDGSDSGIFRDKSCTHTMGERRPWWLLDFGSQRRVYGLSITNRKDCCYERLSKFEVALLTNCKVVWGGKVVVSVDQAFQGTKTFKIVPSDGYKLVIRLKDIGKGRYLTLCEVKVYFKAEDVPKTIVCTGGSTYHALVSPCKDNCEHPNLSHYCKAALRPGCKCPDNQLWDLSDSNNHKCVDAKSCGCHFTHDGEKVHIKVLEHWISKDCKDKYKCLFVLNRPKLYHDDFYQCPENGHCCCKEGCKCTCKNGYQMMMHEHKCVKIHRNPVAIIYKPVAVYELKKAPDGSCAPLSIKTDHTSPCPDTCANPWASKDCKHPSRPGCQCHTGHLFDHEIQLCIPQETCKCYDDNEVGHEVGSRWLNDSCTIMYMCSTNVDGKTEIGKVYYKCPPHSKCHKHYGKDHGKDHGTDDKVHYDCACDRGYDRATDGTCVCAGKG